MGLKMDFIWLLICILHIKYSEVSATNSVCLYDRKNVCSNCTESHNMLNYSYNQNDADIRLCSEYFHLDQVLTIENVTGVTITGSTEAKSLLDCSKFEKGEAGVVIQGVNNFKLSNIKFQGCGVKHEIVGRSGDEMLVFCAIFINRSFEVDISNIEVAESYGIGLAILNTFGNVSVAYSSFHDNKLQTNNSSIIGGGAIYIEISKICQKDDNLLCSKSKYEMMANYYTLEHCIFEHNQITTKPQRKKYCEEQHFVPFERFGRGGGLSLLIEYEAAYNHVTITNCKFAVNNASSGGGIYAAIRDKANSNILQIMHSNFTNNSANQGGGGVEIGVLPVHPCFLGAVDPQFPTNSIIELSDCLFHNNKAGYGGGTSLYSDQSRNYERYNNSIKISECCWHGNMAMVGGAVDLSSHIWNKASGKLLQVQFSDCSFISNVVEHNVSHIDHTYTRGDGTLFSVGYSILFTGNTLFRENKGSALYLSSSIVEFQNGSNATFDRNRGFTGGAINLVGFSALNVNTDSKFYFLGNTAKYRGGAIHVVGINKKELFSTYSCFIQYIGDAMNVSQRNITFSFSKNSAGNVGKDKWIKNYGGQSIFASTLESCRRFCRKVDTGASLDQQNNLGLRCIATFAFEDETKYDICTSGREVRFKDNLTWPLLVTPGKSFALPTMFIDEFKNEIHDFFHLSVEKHSNSTVAAGDPGIYTSAKWIRLFGIPGDKANITIETVNIIEVGATFSVEMQHCPPGYVLYVEHLHEITYNTCICSTATSDKRYNGIERCNDTSLQAYLRRGRWAGYDNRSNNGGGFGLESNFVSSYCPPGYCFTNVPNISFREILLPSNSSLKELDTLLCSKQNRIGTICGKCVTNYSTYYHSSRFMCGPNPRCYLGGIFYLLTEIVPVTIFFVVIMVFNVKLTNGAFISVVFFAQTLDTIMITANGFVVFSDTAYFFVRVSQFVTRMFSLNFFALQELSFCLWESAQALDMLAFEYVTITYAMLLVFVIVLFMRFPCCSRILSKLRGRSSDTRSTIIHGMTGFLVTCYSECVRISLLIITPVVLRSQSNRSVRNVAFYNGEIGYFSGRHLPYALPAIFFLISFGLLLPILLISYPLCYRIFALLRINETRFVSILCRIIPLESLKPFFDSFQSSFKDNCRFFAGLYFVYRLMILSSFTFLLSLTEFFLTAQIQFIVILSVHTIVKPYKKHWHNVLDGFIFAVLACINAMTTFSYKRSTGYFDSKNSVESVTIIQTLLMYAPLLYMALYIVVHTAKKYHVIRKFCKRYTTSVRKKFATSALHVDGDDSSKTDYLSDDYHYREMNTSYYI